MALIVDVLNRIARHCSVPAPSSWVTAVADEHVEIRDDFMRETVNDVLDRVDWPSPIGVIYTINGTGVSTYALPSDFRRLQRNPLSVYDVNQQRACLPVTSDGDWVDLTSVGISGSDRFFRIAGSDGDWEIEFEAAPNSDVKIAYVSNNWMAAADGTAGSAFTEADDVLLLPDRVIEAGTIWRWRERKGLPFSDKYTEFNALLTRYLNDARGRRVVSFKNKTPVRWQDRIPAYIPSA